jgi:hypothetical protein
MKLVELVQDIKKAIEKAFALFDAYKAQTVVVAGLRADLSTEKERYAVLADKYASSVESGVAKDGVIIAAKDDAAAARTEANNAKIALADKEKKVGAVEEDLSVLFADLSSKLAGVEETAPVVDAEFTDPA